MGAKVFLSILLAGILLYAWTELRRVTRRLYVFHTPGSSGTLFRLGARTQHILGGAGRHRTRRGSDPLRLGLYQPYPPTQSALEATDANGIDYDARPQTCSY
jgi:hypothetical protein